jgi:vacuolar-type H+-ATPase subunit I/STV1
MSTESTKLRDSVIKSELKGAVVTGFLWPSMMFGLGSVVGNTKISSTYRIVAGTIGVAMAIFPFASVYSSRKKHKRCETCCERIYCDFK